MMIMPDNLKMSERDQALINILERLVGEMRQQDLKLEALLARNSDFTNSLDSMGRQLRGKQIDTERAVERSHNKLLDSFHHYRSDMLKLVNEQDQINKNIDALQKLIRTTIFTLDATNLKLIELDERLNLQEKISHEHYEYSVKESEVYQSALDDTNINYTKLHADTAKHLEVLQSETSEQLDKFRQETLRRLRLLDGIIASLQTLLIRTEPPERKTPWIARVFDKPVKFFRYKIPLLFSKTVRLFKKDKDQEL